MKRSKGCVVLGVLAVAASAVPIARGQPVPDVPLPEEGSGSGSAAAPAPEPEGSGSAVTPPPPDPFDAVAPPAPAPLPPPKPPAPPPPMLDMPEALTTPTGWLLPAAVLYSKLAIDTGGGVTSDTRVGLGDVAEFGVASIDSVRERQSETDSRPSRIQPYLTASFRLGVAEDRLFDGMPGVTLGFRKSFEREHAGWKTRIAELTLVASKNLGEHFAMSIGGAFWDASLSAGGPDDPEVTLHGFDQPERQIRPFASIQARPLPRSLILVDVGWSPEFCYGCVGNHQIRLRPVLSWGVRYEVARWIRLESGVRVPDIGDANLLDAQIFGQFTLTSWALRRAVDSLK